MRFNDKIIKISYNYSEEIQKIFFKNNYKWFSGMGYVRDVKEILFSDLDKDSIIYFHVENDRFVVSSAISKNNRNKMISGLNILRKEKFKKLI